MTPEEAMQGIVDLVQLILANSSRTPDELARMTISQINGIADAIHRFKIHAWGMGLGKKDEKKQDIVKDEPTTDDLMAFVGRFGGGSVTET
jgi:hypothetical protein